MTIFNTSISFAIDTVDLRMWVYDTSKPIRGVIVSTPCCCDPNCTQLDFYQRTAWQTLAVAHDFAIVGTYYHSTYPTEDGAYQALIDGIKSLATISGHSELSNAPMCLYGFSAGGMFSMYFAQYAPTRTIAFAHNKGRLTDITFTGGALEVPGFISYGSLESERISDNTNAFNRNRTNHALLALVVDWNMPHDEPINSEPLALFYFDQIIECRLPTNYVPGNPYTLTTLAENSGWLGNFSTATVYSHSTYPGNIYTASWLPNQFLANKWHNIVLQGGPGAGTFTNSIGKICGSAPQQCNNPIIQFNLH